MPQLSISYCSFCVLQWK